MTLTFAVESFREAVEDIQVFWGAHWQEVGIDTDDIPLSVDIDFYTKLADAGILRIVVARFEGKAVGYMVWRVAPHPRYSTSLTGTAEVFWLHPEFRKGRYGLAMFQFAETYLRAEGVQRIFASCKVDHDLTSLFEGLGWTHHEKLFTKRLDV